MIYTVSIARFDTQSVHCALWYTQCPLRFMIHTVSSALYDIHSVHCALWYTQCPLRFMVHTVSTAFYVTQSVHCALWYTQSPLRFMIHSVHCALKVKYSWLGEPKILTFHVYLFFFFCKAWPTHTAYVEVKERYSISVHSRQEVRNLTATKLFLSNSAAKKMQTTTNKTQCKAANIRSSTIIPARSQWQSHNYR